MHQRHSLAQILKIRGKQNVHKLLFKRGIRFDCESVLTFSLNHLVNDDGQKQLRTRRHNGLQMAKSKSPVASPKEKRNESLGTGAAEKQRQRKQLNFNWARALHGGCRLCSLFYLMFFTLLSEKSMQPRQLLQQQRSILQFCLFPDKQQAQKGSSGCESCSCHSQAGLVLC